MKWRLADFVRVSRGWFYRKLQPQGVTKRVVSRPTVPRIRNTSATVERVEGSLVARELGAASEERRVEVTSDEELELARSVSDSLQQIAEATAEWSRRRNAADEAKVSRTAGEQMVSGLQGFADDLQRANRDGAWLDCGVIEEIRQALRAASRDIGHWCHLAEHLRDTADRPDHSPGIPSVGGIKDSRRVQRHIQVALSRLAGLPGPRNG